MTESWHHYYVIMTSYLVDNWFEFLNMFDEFIIVILKDFNFFQFISKLSVFSFYPFHISFTHAAYHGFLGTSRSQESIDPWLKKMMKQSFLILEVFPFQYQQIERVDFSVESKSIF